MVQSFFFLLHWKLFSSWCTKSRGSSWLFNVALAVHCYGYQTRSGNFWMSWAFWRFPPLHPKENVLEENESPVHAQQKLVPIHSFSRQYEVNECLSIWKWVEMFMRTASTVEVTSSEISGITTKLKHVDTVRQFFLQSLQCLAKLYATAAGLCVQKMTEILDLFKRDFQNRFSWCQRLLGIIPTNAVDFLSDET